MFKKILKSLLKKLLLIFFIIAPFAISFSYAQTDSPTSIKTSNEGENLKEKDTLAKTLNTILRWIFFILWPLLWISSKAMSNDLVYGSVIWLDKYLWQIWNIMKNFANFVIWFLLIFSILAYIVWFKQDKFSPKKIIPRLFLAGLLVNISWFLMMVLVDISTILTVTFGYLPINVVNKTQDENVQKILSIWYIWDLNLDTSKSSSWEIAKVIYFRDKNKNAYLPCIYSWNLITFDKEIYDKWSKVLGDRGVNISSDTCVIRAYDYGYWFLPIKPWKKGVEINSTWYNNAIKEWKNYLKNVWIPITKVLSTDYQLWPLYYIFYYMLGIASDVDITINWVYNDGDIVAKTVDKTAMMTVYSVKIVITLFLILPLLIFAIIMIIRLFILWIIVAFSPILALLWGLWFGAKWFLEKFDIKSVLTLLLLPATTTFALAIWFLFILAIQKVYENNANSILEKDNISGQLSNIGIEKSRECDVWQVWIYLPIVGSNFCFVLPKWVNIAIWEWVNIVWYLIYSFFGIFLMWILVMTALKTSKFTQAFVSWVEWFVKDIAKAVEFIPIPWWRISIWWLEQAWKDIQAKPSSMIYNQYENSSFRRLYEKLTDTSKYNVERKIENFSKAYGNNKSTLKDKLYELISETKWGNFRSIFDYEDQLLPLFNKAFDKKFNNLEEALKDQDVIKYFVDKWYNIEKLVDNLASEQEKRFKKDKYKNIMQNILQSVESTLKNNWKLIEWNIYERWDYLYKINIYTNKE